MHHIDDSKIIEFLNSELEESEMTLVQAHLDTCAECTANADSLSKIIDALSFEEKPSEEFKNRLLVAIREEAVSESLNEFKVPQKKPWFSSSSRSGKIVLAFGSIAAVIIISLAARVTLAPPQPEDSFPNSASKALGGMSVTIDTVTFEVQGGYSEDFQDILEANLGDVGGKIIEDFNENTRIMSVEMSSSVLSYFEGNLRKSYKIIDKDSIVSGTDKVRISFSFIE